MDTVAVDVGRRGAALTDGGVGRFTNGAGLLIRSRSSTRKPECVW